MNGVFLHDLHAIIAIDWYQDVHGNGSVNATGANTQIHYQGKDRMALHGTKCIILFPTSPCYSGTCLRWSLYKAVTSLMMLSGCMLWSSRQK